MKIAPAIDRDSAIKRSHCERGRDDEAKKMQTTLVGGKAAVIPTVALEKGGGQLMTKKELKKTLLSLAVGILSGYIVALLPHPSNLPKTEPHLHPHLMYVQHQELENAGEQVLATMRC